MAYERKDYVESDAVKQAQAALQKQQEAKPGEYTSKWQGQIDDTLGKLLNREEFKYDINEDALYQQAAQRYIQQGRKAMMDTIGQAQAMTGGYGNSYAESVGQQAYHGYLEGLNDQIPEFYQLALNRYLTEGDQLKERYGLLTDQENQDYGRYRDNLTDWNAELDRLYQQWMNERSYDYGMYSDEQAYNQWLYEFLENQRRYDQEWAAAHPVVVASSGGDDDDDGGSRYTGNPNPSPKVDVEAEYKAFKDAGEKGTVLDNYLREQIKEGNISKDAATELRNKRW